VIPRQREKRRPCHLQKTYGIVPAKNCSSAVSSPLTYRQAASIGIAVKSSNSCIGIACTSSNSFPDVHARGDTSPPLLCQSSPVCWKGHCVEGRRLSAPYYTLYKSRVKNTHDQTHRPDASPPGGFKQLGRPDPSQEPYQQRKSLHTFFCIDISKIE